LDPSSRQPLRIHFSDASVKAILDFIGDATGINVIYDPQFQDRSYTVDLDGVTIEEALDVILTANGYFYQVLHRREIIVASP
jgi:type II secretory pathway component GspD/PulD (secretin)